MCAFLFAAHYSYQQGRKDGEAIAVKALLSRMQKFDGIQQETLVRIDTLKAREKRLLNHPCL